MKISSPVAMIVYAGIVLVILGFILLSFGTFNGTSNTAFGGLVMIDPIPIIIGTIRDVTLWLHNCRDFVIIHQLSLD